MKCDFCIYGIKQIYYGGTTSNYCIKKNDYIYTNQCNDYRVKKECQNCDFYNPQISFVNGDGTCTRTNMATDYFESCKYFKEYKE